jgi:hypothetical protein
MTTSKNSSLKKWIPWTSSVADSHVNQLVTPENDRDKKMSDGSGPKCSDSFAKLDRDGFWLRMSQGSTQSTLVGGLVKWLETWPRAGMILNGIAYLRSRLVPHISARESGSWPTPMAADSHGHGYSRNKKGQISLHLPGAVGAVRYPTPVTKGLDGRPTPVARDWKDVGEQEFIASLAAQGTALPRIVAQKALDNGEKTRRKTLNPAWVEWLMGYPEGWTDLED